MLHDNDIRNKSSNRPFEDILKASLSRRNLLQRSAVMSAAGFMGAFVGESLLAKGVAAATRGGTLLAQTSGLLGFAAVKIADAITDTPEETNLAEPVISEDYQYQALIPWGTPIQPGGPEYNGDPNSRPTAAEQAEMVGIGHDGIWYFGLDGFGGIDGSSTEGMLCVNHEFGHQQPRTGQRCS